MLFVNFFNISIILLNLSKYNTFFDTINLSMVDLIPKFSYLFNSNRTIFLKIL